MALNLDYEPLVAVSTEGMREDEWLAWRRKGIGGSDSSIVMGCSPFRTTRDLYYDKRGIPNAVDDKPNWVALEVGHRLESLVAEIFSRKTGYRTYQIQKMFRHPLFPFMQADVDFFLETDEGRKGILECKTSHLNNMEKWANGAVPYNYELQSRHYMAVMNLDFVWIACLFSNSENDFVMARIDRDLEFEEMLIESERHFWEDYVQAGVEPPYTESGDLVLASLRRHYGPSEPEHAAVTLSPALEDCLAQYVRLKEDKKDHDAASKMLESRMKTLIAPVMDEMGTAENAVLRTSRCTYSVRYASQYKRSIPREKLEQLQREKPAVFEEYVVVGESRPINVKCKEVV